MEETRNTVEIDEFVNNSVPLVVLPTTGEVQLKTLRIAFCIDTSSSTRSVFTGNEKIGYYTYLHVEKEFVNKMLSFLPSDLNKTNTNEQDTNGTNTNEQDTNGTTTNEQFITWNDTATKIDFESFKSLGNTHGKFGTRPVCMFQNGETFSAIQSCDVAVIITDGDIKNRDVHLFSKSMTSHGSHLKAIIGVIVGRRTTVGSDKVLKPSEINVSVLAPALLSNSSCILFYNTTTTFVMNASDVFSNAWDSAEISSETGWDNVSSINIEDIGNVMIPVTDLKSQNELLSSGYVPFGAGLFFHPEYFLSYDPTWDQLIMLPFDRICQYFKITQKCNVILEWLQRQKNRFLQEFVPSDAEKGKIEQAISEIITSDIHRHRNLLAVSNYVQDRDTILARKYVDDEVIESTISDPKIIKLMCFFRNMTKVMEEDKRLQNSNLSYTAASISKNKYCDLEMDDPVCKTIDVDFNEPFKWFEQFKQVYPSHTHNSIKYECSICCETDVPFVLIRKFFNYNDLESLWQRSTDYFYPQILCSKCAGYFCIEQVDPVRVACYAAIPFMNLSQSSKKDFVSSFRKLTNCRQFMEDRELTGIITILYELLSKCFLSNDIRF